MIVRVICTLALMLAAANSYAGTTYKLTVLPIFGFDDRGGSLAYDVNESGQVVGYSVPFLGSPIAFRWSPATGMQNLGAGSGSEAHAINDAGEIVGRGPAGAFLWSSATGVQVIPSSGIALDINNSGQVVGPGFTWSAADGRQDFNSGTPSAINGAGVIAGCVDGEPPGYFQAARWSDTGELDLLPRYSAGRNVDCADEINDAGSVVGYEASAGAILWDPDGTPHLLGPGYASGINSSGQVVGHQGSGGGSESSFLWTAEDGVVLLQSLIANGSSYPDFVLESAEAINDRGLIVGWGRYAYEGGGRRGFLLTPIPFDWESDGILDTADNCTYVANPDQYDADGDGYGNMCDADLNNTGLVTASDYTILRNALNTNDPVADLNHSGLVTATDYTILRNRLNTAPGPSALCAATPAMPCTPP